MENNVLLSQAEIDVLVKFLNNSKVKVGGEVLEQTSVDKLLHIIMSGGTKVSFDTEIPFLRAGSGTAVLHLDDNANIGEQQESCELRCETDSETGYFHIFCINKNTNKSYTITPACLERATYVRDDKSVWGYCIPPVTFDNISSLLQVKYTKETFDFVCAVFAKNQYGDEKQEISSMFMPYSQKLLQHLL